MHPLASSFTTASRPFRLDAVLIVHPYTQFVNQRLEVKEPKQCINLSYLLCMENSRYFYAKQFPVALPPLNMLLIKVGISRGFSLSSP